MGIRPHSLRKEIDSEFRAAPDAERWTNMAKLKVFILQMMKEHKPPENSKRQKVSSENQASSASARSSKKSIGNGKVNRPTQGPLKTKKGDLVECFECKGNHYVSNCPTASKETKAKKSFKKAE